MKTYIKSIMIFVAGALFGICSLLAIGYFFYGSGVQSAVKMSPAELEAYRRSKGPSPLERLELAKDARKRGDKAEELKQLTAIVSAADGWHSTLQQDPEVRQRLKELRSEMGVAAPSSEKSDEEIVAGWAAADDRVAKLLREGMTANDVMTMGQASKMLALERTQEAAELYTQVIASSGHPKAYFERALCYQDLDKWDKATEDLRQAYARGDDKIKNLVRAVRNTNGWAETLSELDDPKEQ